MIIIIRTDLKPYIDLAAINIAYRDEFGILIGRRITGYSGMNRLYVNCVDTCLV